MGNQISSLKLMESITSLLLFFQYAVMAACLRDYPAIPLLNRIIRNYSAIVNITGRQGANCVLPFHMPRDQQIRRVVVSWNSRNRINRGLTRFVLPRYKQRRHR
jgi:hypothetical protein